MPPIYTPLGSIDGNRRGRRPELTPYQRGYIAGAHIAGMSTWEIEVSLEHSRRAIRATLALEKSRPDGVSLPRPGWPIIYTKWDHRLILHSLWSYSKLIYQQCCDKTGLKISNTYIKNLACKHGIHY